MKAPITIRPYTMRSASAGLIAGHYASGRLGGAQRTWIALIIAGRLAGIRITRRAGGSPR